MSIKIRKLDSTAPDFQKSLHAVLAFEASEDEAIERSVAQILNDVKARGDAAVLEYTNRFDRLEAKSVDGARTADVRTGSGARKPRAEAPRGARSGGGARARLSREAEDRVRQP